MKESRYFQVSMLCLPVLPAREVAVAYLSACGFDMFEEDGDALVAYAKEDELVESEYTASLIALRAIAEIRVEEKWMESENWNAKWESNYAPIDVDGKIMMRAPFHAPPSTGLDIIIQPEMSFGTGHHPTTWQMMNAVHGLNPVNQTVLDMGCGTGALAIAASKLGARRVIAIDNDEWSYQNTIENIQRNDLVGKIEVIHGDAASLSDLQSTFDTILANINRNILLRDMAEYTKFLADKGTLVLSGFFPVDIPLLEKEAHANGLERTESFEREGWSCLMLVNNAS
ncbi:MAG: 50S ribosomal protein L11 methyltransferase [Crocinitomicaceae bacterium]|nr:50S ribosomal protein L11 methyltransferase [Crocinitomicaceae bacterium]